MDPRRDLDLPLKTDRPCLRFGKWTRRQLATTKRGPTVE